MRRFYLIAVLLTMALSVGSPVAPSPSSAPAQPVQILTTYDVDYKAKGFAGSSQYAMLAEGFMVDRLIDLRSGEIQLLPVLSEISGLPETHGYSEDGAEAGKSDGDWQYDEWKYVYVNAGTETAGLFFQMVKEIDESSFFRKTYFAEIDLRAKKAVFSLHINGGYLPVRGIHPVGVHPELDRVYFYHYYTDFLSPEGKLFIAFIELRTRTYEEADFEIMANGQLELFVSQDLNKIGFAVYDSGRPLDVVHVPPLTYVYDVPSQTLRGFPGELVACGCSFSPDNRRLYVPNGIRARLTVFDLNSGKAIKTIPAPWRTFASVTSGDGRWFYVFGEREVYVYEHESLSLKKRIPLREIFPEMRSMPASTILHVGPGNLMALFPLHIAESDETWCAGEVMGGFHVIEFSD